MTSHPKAPKPRGMIRDTLRHTAVYSAAGMLGRMISFIMLPFYAHILQDVGYGIIGMIDASLTLLSSLLAYNFHEALLRIYHEQTDPERKSKVVPTGTVLVGLIVLVMSGTGCLLSVPLSNFLLGTSEHWVLICLAMATFGVDSFGQTALTILIIKQRSTLYAAVSLLRLVVGLSLNILLVVVLRWDLVGFFLSGLIMSIVSTVVSVVLMMREVGVGWDREIAGRLLAFQLPLIPGSLASFFSRQMERVIVRFQLDLAALGVLEMAYKFPVLINILFVVPFMRSWGTKRMEIADHPGGSERIGDLFSYFAFLTVFAYLVLAVNIQTVLQILTPPAFWDAGFIARIDAMQVLVRAIGLHLVFGLYYAKQTALITRITIVTSVFKIGISYAMISTWGLLGAAWSGFLMECVTQAWLARRARDYYRFRMDWAKLLIIFGYGAGLLVAIDSISTERIVSVGAPLLESFRALIDGLQGSWLGTWREGRVLQILGDRSEYVLDLAVRSLLVCFYLLIAPIVHIETQQKWRAWMAARGFFAPRR